MVLVWLDQRARARLGVREEGPMNQWIFIKCLVNDGTQNGVSPLMAGFEWSPFLGAHVMCALIPSSSGKPKESAWCAHRIFVSSTLEIFLII